MLINNTWVKILSVTLALAGLSQSALGDDGESDKLSEADSQRVFYALLNSNLEGLPANSILRDISVGKVALKDLGPKDLDLLQQEITNFSNTLNVVSNGHII